MDVLIVLGTTAAWLYGTIQIFIGYPSEMSNPETIDLITEHKYHMMMHEHVHNFETSAILILIVNLGKFIESYSKM